MKNKTVKNILLAIFIACTIGGLTTAASLIAQKVISYTDIYNEDDLKKITNDLNGNYRLKSYIALKNPWLPLGSESHPFTGIFNGNGNAITGLTFDENVLKRESSDALGFFGCNKGTIIRLHLTVGASQLDFGENASRQVFFGAIAGRNEGKITSCSCSHASSSVHFSGSNLSVGGFVGQNSGQLKNCSSENEGLVIDDCSGESCFGAFVGSSLEGAHYEELKTSSPIQLIHGSSGSTTWIGGLVGKQSARGTFLNCMTSTQYVNIGDNIESVTFGGILGNLDDNSSALLEGVCPMAQLVMGNKTKNVGGIVGFAQTSSSINLKSIFCCNSYSGSPQLFSPIINQTSNVTCERVYFLDNQAPQNTQFYGEPLSLQEATLEKIGLDERYWRKDSNGYLEVILQ